MFLRTDEMKLYLTEEKAASPVGYQWHVNHRGCSAGTDKKKRLYIKHTADAFLFYCQHCGAKGYYRTVDRLHRASAFVRTGAGASTADTLSTLRTDLELQSYPMNIDAWPIEARIWWLSYGLEQSDASLHTVQWVESKKRLWMCLGGTWQGRAFAESPHKYITLRTPDDGVPLLCAATAADAPTVLVEDMVSAFKVYKAGRNVLCLMGTKLTPKAKEWLVERNKGVIIWLDDDEAGYVGGMEIRKQLAPLLKIQYINYMQPKEVPLDVIQDFTRMML